MAERAPLGIGLVTAVKVFDVGGVAAIEEGGEQELFVLFLSGHRVLERGFSPCSLCAGIPERAAVPLAADYDGVRLASC